MYNSLHEKTHKGIHAMNDAAPQRKKYDLTDKQEVFPGCFKFNRTHFILVKDGEHYPVSVEKMRLLEIECKGHPEEIVKFFVPRKQRTVKAKEKYISPVAANGEKTSWTHPSMSAWNKNEKNHPANM